MKGVAQIEPDETFEGTDYDETSGYFTWYMQGNICDGGRYVSIED